MGKLQGAFEFKPLREQDLPLLLEWLNRPHVSEWWRGEGSLDELRANYLQSDARPFFAYLDGDAVAYIQSYPAKERGVVGIDQFLAHQHHLSRGLGTLLVRQFVEFLFRDPTVGAIEVDPAPGNGRAIRCYEKAGFRFIARVVGPDGPAHLMRIGRSTRR